MGFCNICAKPVGCCCCQSFCCCARILTRVQEKGKIGTNSSTMTEYDEMLVYLPSDDLNVWMFAMIGIGCLFVVFVAVSIYLMCQNAHLNFYENGTQLINVSKP